MPKRKTEDKPEKVTENLSLRLTEDETARWIEVLRRARQRNPLADKSDVIRELFFIKGHENGLITEEDRLYFQDRLNEQITLRPKGASSASEKKKRIGVIKMSTE